MLPTRSAWMSASFGSYGPAGPSSSEDIVVTGVTFQPSGKSSPGVSTISMPAESVRTASGIDDAAAHPATLNSSGNAARIHRPDLKYITRPRFEIFIPELPEGQRWLPRSGVSECGA